MPDVLVHERAHIAPAIDRHSTDSFAYVESNVGNPLTDLRVRPSTEQPSNAAPYQLNVGVVKLSATGSHAAVVQKLREALTLKTASASRR